MATQKQRQQNIYDVNDAWVHFQRLPARNLPQSGNRLLNLISLAGGKRGY